MSNMKWTRVSHFTTAVSIHSVLQEVHLLLHQVARRFVLCHGTVLRWRGGNVTSGDLTPVIKVVRSVSFSRPLLCDLR